MSVCASVWCVFVLVFGVCSCWCFVCVCAGVWCVFVLVLGVCLCWCLVCVCAGVWCVFVLVFGVCLCWYINRAVPTTCKERQWYLAPTTLTPTRSTPEQNMLVFAANMSSCPSYQCPNRVGTNIRENVNAKEFSHTNSTRTTKCSMYMPSLCSACFELWNGWIFLKLSNFTVYVIYCESVYLIYWSSVRTILCQLDYTNFCW